MEFNFLLKFLNHRILFMCFFFIFVGDPIRAIAEGKKFLDVMLPSADFGSDSSQSSFSNMPEICRNIILSTGDLLGTTWKVANNNLS